jgi:hypothetical protein
MAEGEAGAMSKNGSHDARGAVKSERAFYRRYSGQRQKAAKQKQDEKECSITTGLRACSGAGRPSTKSGD